MKTVECDNRTEKHVLTCLYLNARSLINKLDIFAATVETLHPDVIGVTESWATDKIYDAELQLPEYTMFRKDRAANKGGGVLLYVKTDLAPVEFTTSTSFPEHVWCKLMDKNKNELVIGVCYRSGNTEIFTEGSHQLLRDLIQEMAHKHMLLMGDYNYSGIDWTGYSLTATATKDAQKFLECVEDNFLTQHVKIPTRNANTLDLVLSTEPDIVSDLDVINCLDSSDHNMLLFKVHFASTIEVSRKILYDYSKANFDSIRQELGQIDWEKLLEGNTQNSWNVFKDLVLSMEEKYVPRKHVTNSNKNRKPIWLTHRAKKLVNRKRIVYAKYRDKEHPAVKTANAKASNEVKKSRKRFEKLLAGSIKRDTKSFYAYVRSKNKSKVTIDQLSKPTGELTKDESEVVAQFNEYFTTVFTEEDTTSSPQTNMVFQGLYADRCMEVKFTEEDVKNKLKNLREDKSMGPDRLSPRLLREIYDKISYPLYIIFKKSLREGVVPQDWKTANVTPIYKSGSRIKAENYRPISLTSVVCKILESLMRDTIVSHLEDKLLLYDSQHGFRKGRSCLTNLLSFLDKITGVIDEGDDIDIIYLDFAKAFDKVPHQRLISKLLSHGIDGELREWVAAWLTGRQQRVVINGVMSGWRHIISGVPQGSVLGPILFLIFINDLDYGIKSWILKFADDTKIFSRIRGPDDCLKLQQDVDRLLSWAEEWQMAFNFKKCKVMRIGKYTHAYEYRMKSHGIEEVHLEKDLGILISSDLKVSPQCINACAKANKVLGMINRTIVNKTTEVMVRLYKTLVRPHLEFCVSAWSPHYQKDKELIERVQHRFSRMVTAVKADTYTTRLNKLNLWSLEERRNRADLIEVYRMKQGYSKLCFEDFFDIDTSKRTRGHSCKLIKSRCNKDLRRFFFSQRVVNRWNKLSDDTVSAPSLISFKNKLNLERKKRMDLFSD